MPMFNQAAAHLKEKHLHQKGTEKTGIVFKESISHVINIKNTSGFTWSDEHRAGITDRKDDVWACFTKSHPHAKPFMMRGFDHLEIMEQLMPSQSKNWHIFWATTISSTLPQNPIIPTSTLENMPQGPPSSVNLEFLSPPVPSTFLSPSTEGSAADSEWTSISRGKYKFSPLTPTSIAGSQKQSHLPFATSIVQQEDNETMKDLVGVVHKMNKNLALASQQPSTHVGRAIFLLNMYTNLTSKERLSIANFLAKHENQAIIFYSLDEVMRLKWLEEKHVLCGGSLPALEARFAPYIQAFLPFLYPALKAHEDTQL
ncbi:hypothetical protein BDR07DRAFT_1379800 [Suillus spraguei]|nr:hypothetical protein BDR07DRAFT_1379800 [Suillus spraguei]